MKRIVLGVLLYAIWGVSQAGCLVINNFSNISFSGYNEQSGAFISQSLGADVGNFALLDNIFTNMALVPEPQMASVPEPQIYAMMLAGLGLLGLSLRRRKDDYFE